MARLKLAAALLAGMLAATCWWGWLMLDHAGRSGQEVADPWYTGDFEATWRDLYEGLSGLLSELG